MKSFGSFSDLLLKIKALKIYIFLSWGLFRPCWHFNEISRVEGMTLRKSKDSVLNVKSEIFIIIREELWVNHFYPKAEHIGQSKRWNSSIFLKPRRLREMWEKWSWTKLQEFRRQFSGQPVADHQQSKETTGSWERPSVMDTANQGSLESWR